MKKFSEGDWIAFLLVAVLIWGLLLLAPVPRFCGVAGPACLANSAGQLQHEWQRITSGTHVTDWLTLLVLFLQLRVFGRQATISERQADIAHEQSTISDRQVALDERRFVIQHRPRLRMIQVWQNLSDKGINVFFALVNTGALPGEIRLINFEFAIYLTGQRNPVAAIAETGHIADYPRVLDENGSTGYYYVFKDLTEHMLQRDDASLCVFSGDIHYFPKGSVFPSYVLHFCRELDGRGMRFRAPEDPEYEYSL